MNFKKIVSPVILAGMLLITSCGSNSVAYDDAVNSMVAANEPAMMMSLKVKDLLTKAGVTTKENIPPMFQMMPQLDYITNPEKLGLDFESKMYMAVGMEGTSPVVWITAKIGDADKFAKNIKDESGKSTSEMEGFTVIKEGPVCIGWNGTLCLMVAGQNGDMSSAFKKLASASAAGKKPTASFEKFFKADKDIALFSNMDKITELQKNLPTGGSAKDLEMMSRMYGMMKGTTGLMTLNFENDKIVADIQNTYSDKLKKEMNFLSDKGLPEEVLAQAGGDELYGFIAANGDVQKYMDFIMSIVGEKDMLEKVQLETGIDVKNMASAFKGNVLFSFLGFEKREMSFGKDENGEEMTYTRTEPKLSLVATTNNDELAKLADSLAAPMKKENYFVLGSEFNPAYLAFRPGVLLVTNVEALAATPTTSSPKLDADAKRVLAKPISFYFNLNKIIGAENNPTSQKIAAKFKTTFGGMDMSGGHAELLLNNGGKNSLWTLVNMSVELAMQGMSGGGF